MCHENFSKLNPDATLEDVRREYEKLRKQPYVPESPLQDSLFLPISEPVVVARSAAATAAPAPAGEVLVYDSAPSSIESIQTLSQDGVDKIEGPTQEAERPTKRKRRNRDVLQNGAYVRSTRPKKGTGK